MTWYWNFNTVLKIIVYCIFLHSVSLGYVTSLSSDTGGNGNEDPLSIPLINDNGAPLVAMLDTNTINRRMKSYITTITKNMIKNTLKGHIQDIIRTSLEENSTIDLIRNITLQELHDVLKDQVQDIRVKKREQNYKDCSAVKQNSDNHLTNSVYTIYPNGDKPIQAYCDMTTDGGGWTIIQKRYDGSVNFKRNWTEYENGFGNVNGEYWLGNKHIHRLSSSSTYELRIDLTNTNNCKKYAKYKTLVVGDSASQYKLTIGSYSGNAGDSLTYSNGTKFSTLDRDNDLDSSNCAKSYGPWWFDSCSHSALNDGSKTNWYWYHISGNFVTTSVMMIRKV